MTLSPFVVTAMTVAGLVLGTGLVDPPSPGISGRAQDDKVVIGGTSQTRASKGKRGTSRGPRPIVRYTPVCGGDLSDRRTDNFGACSTAAAACPAPNSTFVWRLVAVTAPNGTVTGWVNTGTLCIGGVVPAAPIPVFTANDLRRLPLPKAKLNVQPPSGRTLVNIPTNLYASSAPATFRVTLLGTPVLVKAKPVSWTWTYGDGTTRTFDTAGAPYPDLGTAHTWSGPGTFTVGLTTTWTATYSVAGGPDLPVDGTATVASPAMTVTAVATRAELVADPRD